MLVYDVRLKCTELNGSWHYYRTTQTVLDSTIHCDDYDPETNPCADSDFVIEEIYDNGE